MKYILTVSLLLTQFLAVKAQYPTDNDLPEKTKKIKLTTSPAEIAAPATPIAGIQVIPVCGDTARLGFVQVGLANKKISARPDKPWNAYLQDFVNTRFKPAFSPSGAQLLWVVKDLRINERTFAMSEKAYVRLKADAYITKDNSHYQLITSLDTVLLKGGMDVTHKHDQNIAEIFGLFWDMNIAAANTPGEATLSAADILSKEQHRFAVPILQTTSYKQGVYKTYQEFLNNEPSIPSFDVKIKKRKATIYQLGTQSSSELVPVDNAWGVCKNGELYRYYNDALIPIEKSGNSFVVSNYLDAINRKNQSIFWGAMLGGIGGAALGSTSGGLYTVTTIPYITRQQPEATTIDVDNGDLMF